MPLLPGLATTYKVSKNIKTTTLLPEFLLSADYQKLRESSLMLQGVIQEGAEIERGGEREPVKNFAEAVGWLMRQAEKGLIRQRYKGCKFFKERQDLTAVYKMTNCIPDPFLLFCREPSTATCKIREQRHL